MRLPMGLTREVIRWTVRPAYGHLPVPAQRLVGDTMGRLQRHPRQVQAKRVVLGGRPAVRYAVRDAAADRAVLWLHGGAFMTGSVHTHGSFAAMLALETGVPVYLLDYRLAPEHKHPAAVDDGAQALADVPEDRVVLGGDSAGGCLALLVLARQVRPVSGLALVSPLVDLTHETARQYDGEEVLVSDRWASMGVHAMFGHDLPAVPDPQVPTVVHVAQHERLRAEGEQLAERVGAETFCVAGGWHDIHLQANGLAVARDAVRRLAGSIAGFLDNG